MSLTIEEVQKTLSDSMQSFQMQMESERKGYKEKIKLLEDTVIIKEQEIKELKEKLLAKKSKKDDKKLIEDLQQEKELIQRELEIKITEFKTALINTSTLNNQLEIKNQNIMQLQLENKQLKEKLKESEDKYKLLEKNLQKQINDHNEETDKENKEQYNEMKKTKD